MTLGEFQRLLDLCGSDAQRWRSDQRGAAATLLAESAQARQMHAEAKEVDRALDAQPLGLDEERSVQRMRASLRVSLDRLPVRVGYWSGLFPLVWARAGAFAAIAAVAIALGWFISEPGENQAGGEDIASLLMRDSPGGGSP